MNCFHLRIAPFSRIGIRTVSLSRILPRALVWCSFFSCTLDLPQNVFWTYESHEYYVKGSLDDRPVTLLFDTGNTNTHMSARYYDRFPSDSSYREGTLKVTQMGRSWETKVFVIEQAKFELCGTNCELSDVRLVREVE